VASKDIMPHDLDCERQVLGACLVSDTAVYEALSIVSPSDFYFPAHRTIVERIASIAAEGEPVSVETVGLRLRKDGKLQEVGGAQYLVALIDGIVSPSAAGQIAKRVRELSVIRQVKVLGRELWAKATQSADASRLLSLMQERLLTLGGSKKDSTEESIRDIISRVFSGLDEDMTEAASKRAESGIPAIDRLLVGFQPGNLIIIAGRPGLGKSWLAGQVALYNARNDIASLLISLEMTKEEVARRIVGLRAGLNTFRLHSSLLSEDEMARVTEACSALYELPIFIDTPGELTGWDFHVRVRQAKLRRDIGLAIVDHLGLIRLPESRYSTRAQELGNVTRQAKVLARELDIPIILLHQLNREVRDSEPKLHHLRDSGCVEQDADVVLFIHRKSAEHAEAELIIAKQRNGPLGRAKLLFDKEAGGFVYEGHPRWEHVLASED